MRRQVPELSDDIEQESQVGDERVGRFRGRCVWSVDPIRDVDTGKEPIVEAVLEDVSRGHGGQTESVHEEGFEFTFCEVERYQDEREGL